MKRLAYILFTLVLLVSASTLAQTTIQLGTAGGATENSNTQFAPINIYYRSAHMQFIYTAAEIRDAGVTIKRTITQLGFYITGVPAHSLPEFTIKMKNTTANLPTVYDGNGLTQVYYNALYTPVAGDYDMLTFSEPFLWDGTSNILVDVCFAQVPSWNSSGQLRIYDKTNGMRGVRIDEYNQCGVATSYNVNYLPQAQLAMGNDMVVETIAVHSYSTCLISNERVGIVIQNETGSSKTGFDCYLVVTRPNGTTQTISTRYNGTLNSGAKDTVYVNYDATQTGTYSLTAYTQVNGVYNLQHTTQVVRNEPYPVPFTADFTEVDNYWWLGDYFQFNTGSGRINNWGLTDDTDTLTSPAFTIPGANYWLGYSVDPSYFDGGNDVLEVQIAPECTGVFTTIDKIYYHSDPPPARLVRGTHNYYTNYYTPGYDLSAYAGQEIQVRFKLAAQNPGAANFTMNGFRILYGTDLKVNEIITPAQGICAIDDYSVKVAIENLAPKSQNGYTVNVEVYSQQGVTKLTRTATQELVFGDIDTLDLGVFDATMLGKYEIIATVTVANDNDQTNNILSKVVEIEPPQPMPFIVGNNFYDYPWVTKSFTVYSNYAQSSFITSNQEAHLASMKLGPVNQNSYLAFDYFIESFDASMNYGYTLGTDDVVNIQVSEDCGQNYTTLEMITPSNHNTGASSSYRTYPSISLASYVGKNINIRFLLKKGTNALSTNSYRINIANIHVGAADVTVSDIETPNATIRACGDNAYDFVVHVTNNSNVKAVNVPVTVELTGSVSAGVKKTLTIPEIAAHATQTVTAEDFDLTIPQNFRVSARTGLVNDYNTDNDLREEGFAINEIKPIPLFDDFSTEPDYWGPTAGGYWSGTYLGLNRITQGQSANGYTMRIGEISGNAYLTFDYLVETFDDGSNLVGNFLREGDTIQILISTDCGNSWSVLHTINPGNHIARDEFQTLPQISLAAYNGSNIRLMITSNKQHPTGSYGFKFDNFTITYSSDAGVTEIIDPDNGLPRICGKANETLGVVVENFGQIQINNVPVKLELWFDGDSVTTLNATTGLLKPGEIDTLWISNVNIAADGAYSFKAYTVLADDLDGDNDDSNINIYVQPLRSSPWYYESLSSYFQQFVSENNGDVWSETPGTIVSPMLSEGDFAYLTLRKFIAVNGGVFRMSYRMLSYDQFGNLMSNYMRPGDKMYIEVTANCGSNFTRLSTIDVSNHFDTDEFTDLTVDLSAYTGQTIAVRVYLLKGQVGKLRAEFDYFRYTVPDPQVNINAIITDKGVCGKTNEPVQVIVANTSQFDVISNVALKVTLLDQNFNPYDTLSLAYTTPINPGEIDTILVGTFNTVTPGEYNLVAWAELPTFTSPEVNSQIVIYPVMPYTYEEDFSWWNNTHQAWMYKEKSSYDGGNEWAQTAVLSTNDVSIIYSPKIGPLGRNNSLIFEFKVTNGLLEPNDLIEVLVSDNCGASYSVIGTITNPQNLNTFATDWTTKAFSLSAYEGKEVIVQLRTSNVTGTANLQVAFDDLYISYIDVSILGIVNHLADFEAAGGVNAYNPDAYNPGVIRYETCGNAVTGLYAVVENTGWENVSGITATVNIEGKVIATLNGTYSNVLLPGNRALISLGNVNTAQPGLLDMQAAIAVANDNNAGNDIIGFSITTQNAYDAPYSTFNNEHFNEDFFWKYDFDFGAGKSHMNVHPAWNIDLETDWLGKGQQAYAITPKVKVGNHTYLDFDYTVQNSVEGHIINGEAVEILLSESCADTWTLLRRIDVTVNDYSSNANNIIDLSSYAGDEIRIKFLVKKGYSNGMFRASFNDITFLDSMYQAPPKPAMPTGFTEVVSNIPTATYTVTPTPYADRYIWNIANGGTIFGITNNATVTWINGFEGTTQITVRAVNAYGVSPESDPLFVVVSHLGGSGTVNNPFVNPNGPTVTGETTVTVYPNPSNGPTAIKTENLGKAQLTITNSLGTVVRVDKFEGDRHEVDLSGYTPGVYIFTITGEKGVFRRTFILK
jgi:hypothetical protein